MFVLFLLPAKRPFTGIARLPGANQSWRRPLAQISAARGNNCPQDWRARPGNAKRLWHCVCGQTKLCTMRYAQRVAGAWQRSDCPTFKICVRLRGTDTLAELLYKFFEHVQPGGGRRIYKKQRLAGINDKLNAFRFAL